MSEKSIFVLLGLGGLAWYLYSTSGAGASSASQPSTGTGGGPASPAGTPSAAAGTGVSAPAANVPSAAAYTGPSLATIYQQLVAAALAGQQAGDPSVTCTGTGMSGLGVNRGGVRAPAGTPTTRQIPGNAPVASMATCQANYDVWNWYLMNRTAAWPTLGIPPVASSSVRIDDTKQITGDQFWAAVAPALQQAVPGLSGLSMGRMLPMARLSRWSANAPKSYYYGRVGA